MNTIAANELKRHGITAIEKLIAKGPVHVIKRNRPVCVVLTEAEYERLTRASGEEVPARQLSVMEWFSLSPLGQTEKDDLDDRLSRERD
jgi:PHD/YefM family antitoxin component YafN of YafNO toxin-antitoxin module